MDRLTNTQNTHTGVRQRCAKYVIKNGVHILVGCTFNLCAYLFGTFLARPGSHASNRNAGGGLACVASSISNDISLPALAWWLF